MNLHIARHILFILIWFAKGHGGTPESGEFDGKIRASFSEGMRFIRLPVISYTTLPLHSDIISVLKDGDDSGVAPFKCTGSGDFPVPGSCKEFYRCELKQGSPSGEYSTHLLSCPSGRVFSRSYFFCVSSSVSFFEPDCNMDQYQHKLPKHPQNLPSLLGNESQKVPKRTRRHDSLTFSKEVQAVSSLTTTAYHLFLTGLPFKEISQGGVDLRTIELKLAGIKSRLNNVSLSVLETQLTNKIRTEVMENIIKQHKSDNHGSFDVTQRLINKGILDSHISNAVQLGLIINRNTYGKSNFAKVQVTVNEVENFINTETTEAVTTSKKGFRSVLPEIDFSLIEPIVSKLLVVVGGFRERLDRLQILPENSREAEIEHNMGFLHYLESNSMENTLNHIIQQSSALSRSESDLTRFFMLELLVDALQIHSSMLSSVVSSTSFLASEALAKTKLAEFNSYIQQVSQSVSRVKISLGYDNKKGFIDEVKEQIKNIETLSTLYKFPSFIDSLNQRSLDIKQVEFNIKTLILNNQELKGQGKIGVIPDFSNSSVRVPLGPWRPGKRVMYAIQFASEKGLSSVGEWSAPYTVRDKACPVISLPRVEAGVIRLLYRRFDEGKPELVAIVRDHSKVSVRDIGRDIMNAAATPNDQAIKDIEALTNQHDVDVNISIEHKMTPLHYAAKFENLNVMDVLISRKADIHAKAFDDKEPLHYAAIYGSSKSLEYLIEKGAEVNAKTKALGLSPLHLAVANNHADATQALIERNAFVNQKDSKGLTSLHISVAGDGDAVDILLGDVNVDVNAIAEDGLTPLHYAARCYNEIYVSTLLEDPRTDVKAKNNKLLTPLHLAAMVGNSHVISSLYEKEAFVSAVDEHGHTAMHYAVFYGHRQAAFMLNQLDSSLEHIKDVQGRTALDLAVENNRKGFIDILNNNIVGLIDVLDEEFSTGGLTAEQNLQSKAITLQEQNSSDVSCNSSVADEIATEAVDTCTQVTNIDSYVTLVMKMVPLSVYYEDQPEFSDIFKNYDHDLAIAKSHSNLWRNGDSIVKGISRTFELSKEFEPEFRRKYKINKERVQVIRANADQIKVIKQLETDISHLEEKRQNISELLKQAQMKVVKSFLETEIINLESEIGSKTRMLENDFTLNQELEELADFLEFVRSDSAKIQAIANTTKRKLEIFRDFLEQDKSAFERHGGIAIKTLRTLKNETIKANKALENHTRRIENLEREIEQKNKEINSKFKQIEEDFKKLNAMHREILDEMDRSSFFKFLSVIAGGIVSTFEPVLGTAIASAGSIFGDGAKKFEQQMKVLKNMADTNREQAKYIEVEIDARRKEISGLYEKMMNSKNISKSLRNELRDFSSLDTDLKNMSSKIDMLLDAIDKALVGVNAVKGIFDEVTLKLEEMIDLAKTAKTEAERRNTKFFIYEELSHLECNWNDVYIKVNTLDSCTKYYKNNFLR